LHRRVSCAAVLFDRRRLRYRRGSGAEAILMERAQQSPVPSIDLFAP